MSFFCIYSDYQWGNIAKKLLPAVGGSEKIKREDGQMGKIVYGRRASNLWHTMIHKLVVIR